MKWHVLQGSMESRQFESRSATRPRWRLLILKKAGHAPANETDQNIIEFEHGHKRQLLSRCATVFGGVVSRDGLGLGRIGAPGYRAHRSVAMAPMFKGIRFGRHHFCLRSGELDQLKHLFRCSISASCSWDVLYWYVLNWWVVLSVKKSHRLHLLSISTIIF